MLRGVGVWIGVAVLVLAGCGAGDDEAARPTATPTPSPTAAAGAGLDEDELVAVHDELYECLRQARFAVLASYADGRASVAESASQPVFDSRLAAPEAERRLLAGVRVEFIGIRRDRRTHARGTPDWDVLIFSSPDAASAEVTTLERESGFPVEQDGIFVRVVRRDAAGPAGARADVTLRGCIEEARPG